MPEKPVYTKIFTRDFTLATVEIWVRPEANPHKEWTAEQLPYSPYILVEGVRGRISAFYDPRGIAWLKILLKKHVRDNPGFLDYIMLKYQANYKILKDIFDRNETLTIEELSDFLSASEKAWVWFEACWWLWELTPEEKEGIVLPESFYELRERTQDIVPEIERLTRASLHKRYPGLGDLIEVLSIKEIASGSIPDIEILEKRHKGYYFANDTLFIGKDRAYIEDHFGMKFEEIKIESIDGNVKGQIAYKGLVRGIVKIVYGPKQIGKVNDGDIVVAPMTMPDVLPAMKKAAAFVTDEGGIMCHAAIIAREMKKPCIIGTKIATQVFKDGDFVEVDAEKGIVRILKRA